MIPYLRKENFYNYLKTKHMNLAAKTKWTNILTAIATFIGIAQTSITNPPFPDATVFVAGAVLTYLMLISTTWKQYLSPDISNTGAHVTIVIAIVATLTGALDLLNVFHVSPITAQWVKWGVSILVLALNVLSKTIFPSESQVDKMKDLKLQR